MPAHSSLPRAFRSLRTDAQSSAAIPCSPVAARSIEADDAEVISAPTSLRKLGVSGAAIPVANDRQRQANGTRSAFVHTDAAPLNPKTAFRRVLTELAPHHFLTLAEQTDIGMAALARMGFSVVRHQRRKGDV